MLRSLFSGVAGLKTHQTKMDVIGNNIANVNTYGFKSSRVTFKDVYYQTLTNSSNATGTMGGGNAAQIGYGSSVGTIDLLNTRSGYASTGNSNDCYIEGEGYFVIQDGQGNESYTQVGQMSFDGDGNLVDGNKNFVCGFPVDYTLEKASVGKSTINFGQANKMLDGYTVTVNLDKTNANAVGAVINPAAKAITVTLGSNKMTQGDLEDALQAMTSAPTGGATLTDITVPIATGPLDPSIITFGGATSAALSGYTVTVKEDTTAGATTATSVADADAKTITVTLASSKLNQAGLQSALQNMTAVPTAGLTLTDIKVPGTPTITAGPLSSSVINFGSTATALSGYTVNVVEDTAGGATTATAVADPQAKTITVTLATSKLNQAGLQGALQNMTSVPTTGLTLTDITVTKTPAVAPGALNLSAINFGSNKASFSGYTVKVIEDTAAGATTATSVADPQTKTITVTLATSKLNQAGLQSALQAMTSNLPTGLTLGDITVEGDAGTAVTATTGKATETAVFITTTAKKIVNTKDLKSLAISPDGTVTGEDADGKIVTIGQIALANIPNAQALTLDGSSYFKAVNNTGTVTYSAPGSNNLGSLKTGGLEMSNVDLSTEFSDMIMTQRGFQANSKIITVSDEMLEELVNLKR